MPSWEPTNAHRHAAPRDRGLVADLARSPYVRLGLVVVLAGLAALLAATLIG